ncbi:hypothetical protein [Bifidobacterium magnum]|uniref:Putative phage protein gp19 n=1 Tax=Bifidobacterium magnum TaxID=1692 RepID=A0A087B693_9BIFI|nr:hypothetical protein [Bifidobacterium magnum]KFI66543.1 putative phage protein gp19 [Bifidobacterium magnum]
MAINNKALMQAARGTLFTAPAGTALPTGGVSKFLLNAGEIEVSPDLEGAKWENLGHTSNSNRLSFSKEGGDTTSMATWLSSSAKTKKEPSTLTVSGASAQVDKATIKKITGGWDNTSGGGVVVPIDSEVQQTALFILAYDDTDKLSFGMYLPETDFSYDTLDFSGEDFIEISFQAVVKSTDTLPKGPNGELGGYCIFSPEDFKAAPAV